MSNADQCSSVKWQSQQLMIKPTSQVEAEAATTKYEFRDEHLAKGVQTASYDTNFETNPVFQLCQSTIYELTEGIPTVDLNITKTLDGWCPMYVQATTDASSPTLFGRAECSATVAIGIYPCDVDFTSDGTAEPRAVVVFPDVQINSLSYAFTADGTGFSEDVSFSGNNVIWWNAAYTDAMMEYANPCSTGNECENIVQTFQDDYSTINMTGVCNECGDCSRPKTKIGTTEDFLFVPQDGAAVAASIVADTLGTTHTLDSNGQLCDPCVTILPPEILISAADLSGDPAQTRACCAGINVSLNAAQDNFDRNPKLCIQSINVNTDLNREDVLCLGQKGPKTRTITPPISVTTAIEVTSTFGAQISALQNGIFENCTANKALCRQAGLNLKNQTIRIVTCEGLYLYMGTRNKLQSVSTTGGGTDGDNLTVTYTYQTFNTLTVVHEDEGRCNPNSVFEAGINEGGWLDLIDETGAVQPPGTVPTEDMYYVPTTQPNSDNRLCENNDCDDNQIVAGDPSSNLVTTKTVDDVEPNEGDTVTFTVTVVNNGPDDNTNVSLTDLLPAGLTYDAHIASQGAYIPATGVWTIGALTNGSTATLDVSATVDAGTAGTTINNTTTAASGDVADPTTAGNDLSQAVAPTGP